jgi:hypothetical protein
MFNNRVEYQNWSDLSIHSSFILDMLVITIYEIEVHGSKSLKYVYPYCCCICDNKFTMF